MVALALGLHAGMFSQGSKSVGIKLGSASVGNEEYAILGLKGNYFAVNDLSLGLGYEKWFSGDPDIQKVTAETTYYIPAHEEVRPYLGLLYRRIIIGGGLDDVNAYGYRAGIAFVSDDFLISAGIVQEKYDSAQRVFGDTETYAELIIGFVF